MQVQRFGAHIAAWLVLLVVHPAHQSRGLGKELVTAVIDRAAELGAHDVLLASAIPRYLWPGVDTANTRAGMLLETFGFERDWVGTNMAIDTSFRRTPAGRRHGRARDGFGRARLRGRRVSALGSRARSRGRARHRVRGATPTGAPSGSRATR